MKFRNWYEAVMTTTTAPPKPPDIDEPDEPEGDGDYDHFDEKFHMWTKANGPCFKHLVSLTTRMIEEHLKVIKEDIRIVPFGGFADVAMEAKGVMIPLLEGLKKAVLGNCDLWKALGLDYTQAASMFMKPGFNHWFGNSILTAIFGNPMFIGDENKVDSMANFLIWDYFKKNPQRKKELGAKVRADRPKADMVLGDVYGNFRLKYPDVYLVGYMSVRAAEGMIGAGDKMFDAWMDAKKEFGNMDVYDRQKGDLGHVSFVHRDGVVSPISNFRLSPAIFMEALEVLAWWCEQRGYGYGMPRNVSDRDAWPMIKRFFERWGKK
jgi:hypothetical protein